MKCPACDRNDLTTKQALSNHMRKNHPGLYAQIKFDEQGEPHLPRHSTEEKMEQATATPPPATPAALVAVQPVRMIVNAGPTALTRTLPREDGHYVCPECGRDDFTTPTGLGAHRKSIHHVAGKSTTAVKERANKLAHKKAKTKQSFPCEFCGREFPILSAKNRHRNKEHQAELQNPSTQLTTTQPGEQTNGNSKRRTLSRQAEDYIDPRITAEIIAYTVGKIESVAARIAEENDLPSKQFTRRCAEYFLVSARR